MPLAQNPIAPNAHHLQRILLSLPPKVGDIAVAFSKARFTEKAWVGSTTQPWKARKATTKWGKTPRNKGRALLVDTGRLRRSIMIKRVTQTTVTIGTNVPYASVHNFGYRGQVAQNVGAHTRQLKRKAKATNIATGRTKTINYKQDSTVSAHTRIIKQAIQRRQFMGHSPYQDKQIQRLISSQIAKAFTTSP
jgi:phage gpG-like protein